MGYVDGTTPAPSTTDASHKKWEMKNYTIMSWLIHSMIPEIGEGYLGMKTAQDIWESVAATNSHKGNEASVVELERSIGHS